MNQTPLMAAAITGNVPLVEALLERGADSGQTDDYGCNALHWAMAEAFHDGKYASVMKLVRHVVLEHLVTHRIHDPTQDDSPAVTMVLDDRHDAVLARLVDPLPEEFELRLLLDAIVVANPTNVSVRGAHEITGTYCNIVRQVARGGKRARLADTVVRPFTGASDTLPFLQVLCKCLRTCHPLTCDQEFLVPTCSSCNTK
jgi:hypothetical protein